MNRTRGWRIEQDERVINNRGKIAKTTMPNSKVAKQPHRNLKKHPFDCGKSRCLLCSHAKLLALKSIKQQQDLLRMRDELEDYNPEEDRD